MRPLLPLVLAALAACTTSNDAHCGNQKGHQTCFERDPAAKFCNICVADNNGCVAEAPAEDCFSMTAPPVETTTSATTGSPTTDPDPDTTVDPPTTTPTTTPDPATSTTGPGPTTEPGTTTTSTTTTSETATAETTASTTTTTGDTSDTDSSSGTTAGPMCGNGVKEAGEKCDGADLAGVTCETVLMDKWDDGDLACTATCKSFDDTGCCYQLGHLCNPLELPQGRCCQGLKCKLDAFPSLQSHCAP